MKLLITGANGMLGRALCNEFIDRYEITGIVKESRGMSLKSQESGEVPLFECDICDKEKLSITFKNISPDIIIHTAAYTDVDGCELNPQKASAVNSLGTYNVVFLTKEVGAVLVYISTDYVFDGKKATPYIESDETCPINVYGRSKLEGERHVETNLKRYFIFRTSWLFGKGGRNFVDSIINKARAGEKLRIVNDQVGSPTWTVDLASGIGNLLKFYSEKGKNSNPNKDRPYLFHIREGSNIYGIYHLTNSGRCSWHEFAKVILAHAGIKDAAVNPITTQELNRPANRPALSILDNTKYENLTGTRLRPWQEAVREYLLGFCNKK